MRTEQIFRWGSVGLVLSLPFTIVGNILGYTNPLYHKWLVLAIYMVFFLAVSASVVGGSYSRERKHFMFACLVFGLWYIVTSVFGLASTTAAMVMIYAIGFAIGGAVVILAWRFKDISNTAPSRRDPPENVPG